MDLQNIIKEFENAPKVNTEPIRITKKQYEELKNKIGSNMPTEECLGNFIGREVIILD